MSESETEAPQVPPRGGPSSRLVIVLVVLAVFGGLVAAKAIGLRTTSPAERQRPSITSARNDASADYEAAMKTGKPVYVLFHSLT